VNHGISTGALFLLVGMIYERRHTRDIDAFGGLWKVMPVYAVFFLVTMLASVGLPGLNGFVGEFLALLGAYIANPWWALFATFGVVLAAIYLFQLFGRMMFGPVDNPENRVLHDLTGREIAILAPLVILMFVMGVAPNLFLDPMQPTLQALVETLDSAAATTLQQ
nr:Fe-S-binding domain-containing protein [Geodermatophilaceae bacterium]